MLPPVLEIFVIWHPGDLKGSEAARQIFEHFHGTIFSGLIGGAIEVYTRSDGWRSKADSPRPIPFPNSNVPDEIPAAHFVVAVPILGNELAASVDSGLGVWWQYLQAVLAAQIASPERVGVFPLLVDSGAMDGTKLGELFGPFQRIAAPSADAPPEPASDLRCRDLAQGIAQLALGPTARLNVFISHTKWAGIEEGEDVPVLIRAVRNVIADTRLRDFFDTSDLQQGRNWDDELRSQAANSALLAIRTDLYASRTWCQREMLIAKCHGMPIVILDSLGGGEERGSFLMDHLPRIPVRQSNGQWRISDVRRGLNLLVDECLKRVLWNLQRALANSQTELSITWWAPHAPEPITLAHWLDEMKAKGTPVNPDAPLRILHPDPPLGPDERETLRQIAVLTGHRGSFEVMTPRILAARGV